MIVSMVSSWERESVEPAPVFFFPNLRINALALTSRASSNRCGGSDELREEALVASLRGCAVWNHPHLGTWQLPFPPRECVGRSLPRSRPQDTVAQGGWSYANTTLNAQIAASAQSIRLFHLVNNASSTVKHISSHSFFSNSRR